MTNQPMDKQISAFDSAYEMICDTEHQEVMAEGMEIMKQLADEGDMHAAAVYGMACSFEHIGHYDPELCKKYLEMAVAAEDPEGMYRMGFMMYNGEVPFETDKVYGLWLIKQAAEAGHLEAQLIMETKNNPMSPRAIYLMGLKAYIENIFLGFWQFLTTPFRRNSK